MTRSLQALVFLAGLAWSGAAFSVEAPAPEPSPLAGPAEPLDAGNPAEPPLKGPDGQGIDCTHGVACPIVLNPWKPADE